LGGTHKYDLTPDVTHLIVGDYDTPKYRHVAKERPDIKAMDSGWIEAVRDLWVTDAEIDLVSLEKDWELRPLETSGFHPSPRGRLLCCMTGFDARTYNYYLQYYCL
jgi:DNA replication regulator DPB11